MTRRALFFMLGSLVVASALLFSFHAEPTDKEGGELVVRISHFRPSIPATVQKARGSLERRLAQLGAKVQWVEFKVTPDSALAATSGSVDFMVGGVEGGLSTLTLDVPAKILVSGPHGEHRTGWYTALLVRENSPIKTLADLRGKKIGVSRGGFSEAVLALAVRKGGLEYPKDVEPVYLGSPDSQAAYLQGLVDAVLTLDPYVVQIQKEIPSRILTDNEALGYPTVWAVLVLEKFAEKNPKIVQAVTEEFLAIGPWIATHREETAESLAQVIGFDNAAWNTTLGRASYVLEVPTEKSLVDVQSVADRIFELGVLRKRINATHHVWSLAVQTGALGAAWVE